MFKIPLVPVWNLKSGCVCTPDGGFLYAGYRSLNFISSIKSENGAPKIHRFPTSQGILSLDVDPQWGQKEDNSFEFGSKEYLNGEIGAEKENLPNMYFAALLQDYSVQIWDFNKGCALQGHKAHSVYMHHMGGNGPLPKYKGEVLISYMCNRNVLSVDSKDIVIYCVASNSFYRRPLFISSKQNQLTLLKCSPYNENVFAVGTNRGLVLICDLQKMVILYTLRGHDSSITSLAWNRIDLSFQVDISTEEEQTTAKHELIQKEQTKQGKLSRSNAKIYSDEIFDIYDYDYLDNEFGAPSPDVRAKNDSISDFVGIEKCEEFSTTTPFDFAEACESLKEEIVALKENATKTSPVHVVSLDDCKEIANNQQNLSSCGSACGSQADDKNENVLSDKGSSDNCLVSLECLTPSSEESVDIDGMPRNQLNIICEADVHQIDHYQNNDEVTYSIGNDTDIKRAGTILSETEKEEKESGNKSYDILLASSSVDGTFCVWNATNGARCDTQNTRSTHGGKNNNIEISWISSTSIIINNRVGELQLWTVIPMSYNKVNVNPSIRMYKFEKTKLFSRQRSVMSFACSPKNLLLWTISANRDICMEDMRLNNIQLNFTCVSTNIGAMRECPDDMNKIALGFSDRRVGIIDISTVSSSSVHIENFAQRIESCVMALAWSPDCKKLAYGTIEGRIGILNIENSNKQPFNYNSIFGKPIYSICWQDKYLYVVCNECVTVYEDDPNKKDGCVIPNIKSAATISLRNNYLFVGTQDGHLKMYVRTDSQCIQYKHKTSLALAPRYISEIAWSPIVTNRFAVAANFDWIHILELNDETAELKITRKIKINTTKAASTFVKWSNRNENYFLTCGYDGTVRVWDLSNENSSEKFIKTYHCPMTCGLFLPSDEEIIICSGKNAAFEVIDMRFEKSESNSKKLNRTNKKTMDTVQWATKAAISADAKFPTVDKKVNCRLAETTNNSKSKALELEHRSVTAIKADSSVGDNQEVSAMMENLLLPTSETSAVSSHYSIYMKNPQTLLYLTTKEINKDALEIMFSILSNPQPVENMSLSQKLFGTKAEAKQVLLEELKNHQRSETKGICKILMPQLNGDLKEEILKLAQSKQLCEWHVSLAPSISYSFWQKCCQAFAEQLIEQGHAMQAASYMLAIHKQQSAISMLIANNLFKEALLIARIYLQPDDPQNNFITDQWISYLFANGNLTGAALLSLLTKKYDRAYEYLSKIRNNCPEIERVIRLLHKFSPI